MALVHSRSVHLQPMWLIAAVITQLFAYIADKGIQYGYVCTGKTFIFLHIPQDPWIVYYSVCVQNLDNMDDDEDRPHHVAVTQVIAFEWHDRAKHPGIWDVEFEDVLRDIPETDQKPPKDSPLYNKGQRWRFKRSPIKTRARYDPPSPSASRPLRPSMRKPPPTNTATRGAQQGSQSRGRGKPRGQKQKGTPISIQDRPFCTQKCLCPNFDHHQQRHIQPPQFLHLIRNQLASDRGSDADAIPLYLHGSIGALFKVHLPLCGYTPVAKGHEHQVYNQLCSIQGKHAPVCFGIVELVLPYCYDGGVFVHFLFLSWAGRPLFDMPRGTAKDDVVNAVRTAFTAVRRLQVLHCNTEARNVLYDQDSDRVIIVDFERAEIINRKPLGAIRKRKGYDFARELLSIISSVQQCIQ
ncbi:hypothetical protein F5B18DRAFT_666071 [Nemania serpens]|nr:hypothetical protein F5B18DRAFT_666071 [Nemania serpens]